MVDVATAKFRETINGHQVIYQYDIRDGADMLATVDDWWKVGLFKGWWSDTVRVWRPLFFPPTVARRTCRHGKGRGEAMWEQMVHDLVAVL